MSGLLLAVAIFSISDINAQQTYTRATNNANDHFNLQEDAIFKFIRTVQVTPDNNFSSAGFIRIGYVHATNNLIATFGSKFTHSIEGLNGGYAYKEYNLDMQPTGKFGALYEAGGDIGGLIANNIFYAASMDANGWRLVKYDAVTWMKMTDILFPLDMPKEQNGDMMVSLVNGRLDISSQYTTYGGPPSPEQGGSTHHEFFSPNLEFLEKKILSDTPHICGSAMIFVDGIYYLISATAYTGDVIVMKYDKEWKYLGMKELIKQAHWSEGVAFDGQRFFITYLNTNQRTEPGFFPYYPNVHLAGFDLNWNLIEDVAVTNYVPKDALFTGRPWVLLHGNKLYVSYDVVPLPEDLDKIESVVSIYELNSGSTLIEPNEDIIKGFQLDQNFPNPCNALTSITYSLPSCQMATLKIYDIYGHEVAVLINEIKPPGKYTATFNAKELLNGAYFIQFVAGNYIQTRKCLVMK
jgi:hypothetical protein